MRVTKKSGQKILLFAKSSVPLHPRTHDAWNTRTHGRPRTECDAGREKRHDAGREKTNKP